METCGTCYWLKDLWCTNLDFPAFEDEKACLYWRRKDGNDTVEKYKAPDEGSGVEAGMVGTEVSGPPEHNIKMDYREVRAECDGAVSSGKSIQREHGEFDGGES